MTDSPLEQLLREVARDEVTDLRQRLARAAQDLADAHKTIGALVALKDESVRHAEEWRVDLEDARADNAALVAERAALQSDIARAERRRNDAQAELDNIGSLLIESNRVKERMAVELREAIKGRRAAEERLDELGIEE